MRSARKLKLSTPSPSLHAAIAADRGGDDELVELLFGIGVRDRRLRVGKARPLGLDHRLVGPGDALPALVAVHRVVAADHGRDRHRGRQRGHEPLEIVAGRLRRRIAAVGDGMHERRNAGVGQDFCQRCGMVLMRMHAARRDQARSGGRCRRFSSAPGSGRERWRLSISPSRDGVADPRQVLHHDAAGADIEVADLGIAHLARRQADVAAGGAQERARAVAQSRSKVGVLACRMALSAASSRQPQPSSTTSITGRRFCMRSRSLPEKSEGVLGDHGAIVNRRRNVRAAGAWAGLDLRREYVIFALRCGPQRGSASS